MDFDTFDWFNPCGKPVIPFWCLENNQNADEACPPPHNRQPIKALSTLPPPPGETFVERPEISSWLRKKCERSQTRAALVGPPGVGKSQIALKYAHEVWRKSSNTFVFWIEASTDGHIKNAFRDIASRLRLPGHDDPNIDALPLVSSWLSQAENGRWFMVVDSAENTDMFCCKKNAHASCVGRSCLPNSPSGSILFTSRNPNCLLSEILDGDLDFYNATYKVPVMNIYQAFQLLRNELDEELADAPSRMADLAYALGREPRAITQAAKVLNFRGLRTAQMGKMDEFRDLWPASHGAAKRSSLTRTWDTTFQQLRQQRSQAVDLLYLMSFFNEPNEIMPRLALISFAWRVHDFQSYSIDDDELVIENLDKDIDFLKQRSLVLEAGDGQGLVLTPLVGFFTQIWLFNIGEQTRWKSRLLRTMAKKYSGGTWDNWEAFEKLDNCFQAMISFKIWSKTDRLNSATITQSLASYRYNQGRFQEAESLLRRVIAIRGQSLGPDDVETIRALNNIGILFQIQGKLGEAEQTLRLVLEVREKILGKQHKDTLSSAFALANVLLKLERFADAEALHRETLSTRLLVLGKDHFHTLTSLDGLGEALRLTGEYEESERALYRAVNGKMRVLGTENPHTLSSVYGLAATLRCQGKYEDAEKWYRKGLKGCEKILGRDHPTTRVGIHGLIRTLREQNKDGEACHIKAIYLEDASGGFKNDDKPVGKNDAVGPMYRCHIDIQLGY